MYQMVQKISVHGRTSGTPDAVYALLLDGATWPRWSPLGSFRMLDKKDGELGALRRFRTTVFRSDEEIVALEPGRRFAYALRAGLALRDYVAYLALAPADAGTETHWHPSFRSRMPCLGSAYRR